jgi:hypothetical protein
MKKSPEHFEGPEMEQNESPILTPSEIGALSPRVPRRAEMLREAPKPVEARILDEDGNEIVYLPEQVGDATPDSQFIKSGDRTKRPWVFKGKTKDGKVVLETEDGEGLTIAENDFQRNYERSRRVYLEKTKDGKREIKIDTEAVLQESVGFYNAHDLKDFLRELPKDLRLSAQSEAKLREAMREGFDSAMLLPSTDLQKGNVNKLLTELADKKLPGLQDNSPEQLSQDHYMYQPDVTKNASARNRPARKAYLLLYQSGPLPEETMGKTPDQLDPLFAQKKWNGLTLEEYVVLQRKEFEARKNHEFDAYNDDAKKSKWTWLLDSRVPGGVVRASWNPGSRRVGVIWDRPGSSDARLGARPAVVVEVEV